MKGELIIVNEYCLKCNIEPSFILLLEEVGLIEIREIANEKYFHTSQLYELEKYIRWYYDLSINIEGIEVIKHLLEKMNVMREEIRELRMRLNAFD